MKTIFFKPGEEIFHEGKASDCAYIIELGRVEVSRTLPTGEKNVVGVLGANEIFGEMGLIDGLPRSCTVKALEDCQISELSREGFESLAKNHPETLMPILRVLTNRLRATLKSLEELKKGDSSSHPVTNPN